MDPKLIINATGVAREIEIAPGNVQRDQRNPIAFLSELGRHVPFETGLMPPGVLSIRQAGTHQQIVLTAPPGINRVNWALYERDKKFPTYLLAQPWRVMVCDFVNGGLLGARMFYSPSPISSLDQPLYHVNLPNINCRGYRGNGVGWVCLYHKDDMSKMDTGQKALRMLERCSGVETYNDANMSSTDGPRFYAHKGYPGYMSDPKAWEAKTDKDGVDWALQDVWCPILVKSQDDQDRHHDGGVPLTLRMAMYGNAAGYYGDKFLPKTINAITREDMVYTAENAFADIWTPTYTTIQANAQPVPMTDPNPGKTVTPKKPALVTEIAPVQVEAAANPWGHEEEDEWDGFDEDEFIEDDDTTDWVQNTAAVPAPTIDYFYCAYCGNAFVSDVDLQQSAYGLLCLTCVSTKYWMCDHCHVLRPHNAKMEQPEPDGSVRCTACTTMACCSKCYAWHAKDDTTFWLNHGGQSWCCIACYASPKFKCFACAKTYVQDANLSFGPQLVTVPALGTEPKELCYTCFDTSRMCSVCLNLGHVGEMIPTNEGEILHPGCGQLCDSCGRTYLNPKSEHMCPNCEEFYSGGDVVDAVANLFAKAK